MEYENNIIHDAYYLINKFNEEEKNITNMQIQKLMYFFEALYMNINTDVDHLYDCNFNAWAFGPVAIPLYTQFRKFGNNPIELNYENMENAEIISENKKKILDKIYEAFKDVSAIELVNLTHMEGSPWDKVWKRNGKKVGYGENTYINKIETRDWFKLNFGRKQ